MFRIAHISDLHICHPDVVAARARLVDGLGDAIVRHLTGLQIEAHAHDRQKLEALEQKLAELQPDVVVVTGDLTNYGDESSFAICAKFLRSVRTVARARRVLVVPGNHDTLVERFNRIRSNGDWRQAILLRLGQAAAGAVRAAGAFPEQGADLFGAYRTLAGELGQAFPDPALPEAFECEWGPVRFHLFNSVNDTDDLLMANRGAIGPEQFRRLAGVRDPEPAVRIALLHHHPICSPDLVEGGANRFYDWMEDGPLLVSRLNERGFQLVLHGHQHAPFDCRMDFRGELGGGLQIIAAGSALSGTGAAHRSSFNVIDLLSPYHATLARHEFEHGVFADPKQVRTLALASIESIRAPVGRFGRNRDAFADRLTRDIVRGAGSKAIGDLDACHRYDWLHYGVEIVEEDDGRLRYVGAYRRVGRNVGTEASAGPVFVITGSPGMTFRSLDCRARDAGGDELSVESLDTFDSQLIVRVCPRRPLAPQQPFDVTLRFEWKTVLRRTDAFDALSLLDFRHPIGRLSFVVTTPWLPTQTSVREVFRARPIERLVETGPDAIAGAAGRHRYAFDIDRPARTVFQVYFGERASP